MTLRWKGCEHFANIADETHVEHAIGFIEHQNFYSTQIDGTLLHEIEQTTGRRDKNIEAARESLNLRIDVHATKNDRGSKAQVFAIRAHALLDLRGEFARRGEHQCAHGARSRTWFAGQQLQHGQGESCSFTSACLGAGEQIATF